MRLDMISLDALRTFEVSAHELSFTKAALHLNITQSAVSQQIRMLESRLGYPLFIRLARSLVLTEKGKILFESISKSFYEINRTLNYLDEPNTQLQINCLPSFALQWLMPRLSTFYLNQTNILIKLKAEFQELNHYQMQTDNIDLGIRFDPDGQTDLHTEILMDEYLIPVATPQYLKQHPLFAAGHSLENVTLLHDSMPWIDAPQYIEWRTWMENAKPEWLTDLGGIEFNLSSLAISAALNHQGVAIGRTALVYDDIMNGNLVNVFNLPVRSRASYKILYAEEQHAVIHTFLKWLKEESAIYCKNRNVCFDL
ncbi:LysR family transcriptional regulator [Acinetobacter populi]|uniref:LysR family transcriptional regulator n=1 Tax=Acinetobacter populi TaxID=1582270 RepID=A0A1Z9YTX4_9GAMM|nr:LysR family transcriptional regulator [Acinetobacter populi]OUY05666.1 LysR family transcriptional regulator [Acinetobacter populi]